jgi:hypothetical protein
MSPRQKITKVGSDIDPLKACWRGNEKDPRKFSGSAYLVHQNGDWLTIDDNVHVAQRELQGVLNYNPSKQKTGGSEENRQR